MNETLDLVGKLVRYTGDNRDGLYDLIGVVEKVSGRSAGVRYSDGIAEAYKDRNGLVWAADWAWTEIEPMAKVAESTDLDGLFTQAAGGKLSVAKAEIARLEAELAKLKTFVEVYESL